MKSPSRASPFRLFLLACTLAASAPAQATLDFVITGGNEAAIPIAVVPFTTPPGVTEDVAKVIEDDLERSGLFKSVLQRSQVPLVGVPTQPEQVDYSTWRRMGAEHLVIGRLTADPMGGGYAVRFYLLDVFGGTQTLGQDMLAVPVDQLRYSAHDIADLIYKALTGVDGYFNSRIAYVTSTGAGNARSYQLVVADSDGHAPRTLLQSPDTIMSPAWSRDRRQLAYVAFDRAGRSGIWVQDLATAQRRQVVSEKGINGAPAWSPDGRTLAICLSFETNADIYLVDVASGSRRRLTDHWAIDTQPTWAPDGRSVAFTSDRGGRPQVYLVAATGGEPRRITFEGKENQDPSFSPDGTKLAVVNLNESSYRIALLDLEKRDLRILSDGPLDESPSFAPNGMVIIYATTSPRGSELATVSTDGRVRQAIRQAGEVREPSWSPSPLRTR